jgi:hypothetical protein
MKLGLRSFLSSNFLFPFNIIKIKIKIKIFMLLDEIIDVDHVISSNNDSRMSVENIAFLVFIE